MKQMRRINSRAAVFDHAAHRLRNRQHGSNANLPSPGLRYRPGDVGNIGDTQALCVAE
jgi:hypothetical protein